MALAVVRNYDSFNSPTHFKLTDLLRKFDKTFGATKAAEKGKYGKVEGERTIDDIQKRRADRWENFLFIAGMWVLVILFNYDFRRIEDVHHPVCHAAGRDFLLRVQHRHRLEKYHREDAHDRDAHQVVSRSTAATRSSPAGSA